MCKKFRLILATQLPVVAAEPESVNGCGRRDERQKAVELATGSEIVQEAPQQ